MQIGIIIFNGFDELDAIGPLEVFRHAAACGGDFEASLITREPADWVTGSHGVAVRPDGAYQPGQMDALVVVGGAWNTGGPVGARAQVRSGEWLPLLKAEADAGTTMLSVCTGAMLLAHAGVIGGRRATTHHSAWDDLRATGAELSTERVVDSGSLITAGGVTSGIDLALWLIEREGGRELADEVRAAIEYEPQRQAPGRA